LPHLLFDEVTAEDDKQECDSTFLVGDEDVRESKMVRFRVERPNGSLTNRRSTGDICTAAAPASVPDIAEKCPKRSSFHGVHDGQQGEREKTSSKPCPAESRPKSPPKHATTQNLARCLSRHATAENYMERQRCEPSEPRQRSSRSGGFPSESSSQSNTPVSALESPKVLSHAAGCGRTSARMHRKRHTHMAGALRQPSEQAAQASVGRRSQSKPSRQSAGTIGSPRPAKLQGSLERIVVREQDFIQHKGDLERLRSCQVTAAIERPPETERSEDNIATGAPGEMDTTQTCRRASKAAQISKCREEDGITNQADISLPLVGDFDLARSKTLPVRNPSKSTAIDARLGSKSWRGTPAHESRGASTAAVARARTEADESRRSSKNNSDRRHQQTRIFSTSMEADAATANQANLHASKSSDASSGDGSGGSGSTRWHQAAKVACAQVAQALTHADEPRGASKDNNERKHQAAAAVTKP